VVTVAETEPLSVPRVRRNLECARRAVPLQVPPAPQSASRRPPAVSYAQEYVAADPYVVTVAVTAPLDGAVTAPQSLITHVGGAALHVLSDGK